MPWRDIKQMPYRHMKEIGRQIELSMIGPAHLPRVVYELYCLMYSYASGGKSKPPKFHEVFAAEADYIGIKGKRRLRSSLRDRLRGRG